MATKPLASKYSKLMRELGKRGGRALAKKYDRETRAEWGKRGGRPKKTVNVDAAPSNEQPRSE